MRLYIALAISLCFILPGCIFTPFVKQSNKASEEKHSDRANRSGKAMASQVAGEPVEDLAFEEDATDLMAEPEGESFDLVEETTLGSELQARQMQQAQYGFKPIYFPFDRYHITEEQKEALKHDLKIISRLTKPKRKAKTVVIEGHADCYAGSHEYNMHLSEKRAQSVKRYLIEHGVPEHQLNVVGRGDTMCIVPSGDKEQQAPNRRVEFYVLNE